MSSTDSTFAGAYDPVLLKLADYVCQPPAFSPEAYRTAELALLDALAGAVQALQDPDCTRLLGPMVPGTTQPFGARLPGTDYELDPATAAFGLSGCAHWDDPYGSGSGIRRSYPSDHVAVLLALGDWLGRNEGHPHQLQAFGNSLPERPPPTLRLLPAPLIPAHEIQGLLAQENAAAKRPLEPLLLLRVASTAVATRFLGGDRDAVLAALSHAWLDGCPLSANRSAPSAQATGDAASRAIQLALRALAGEPGCPRALSAPQSGFEAVALSGQPVLFERTPGCLVMETLLFQLGSAAAPHVQPALDAACRLHPQAIARLSDIARIEIHTHGQDLRPFSQALQTATRHERARHLPLVVVLGLLCGRLIPEHLADEVVIDPRVGALLARTRVHTDASFAREFLDPEKLAAPHSVQLFFNDGSSTERIVARYPAGHRHHRLQSLPLHFEKALAALACRFEEDRIEDILGLFDDSASLQSMPVSHFVNLWVP